VSLTHIRSAVNDEDIYCGHPGPDLWVYSEEEATCADCIRLFLQDIAEEYREALQSFVMRRAPIPGPEALKCWAVDDKAMTKAEVLLGMLRKT
jgi:hypothetical protein